MSVTFTQVKNTHAKFFSLDSVKALSAINSKAQALENFAFALTGDVLGHCVAGNKTKAQAALAALHALSSGKGGKPSKSAKALRLQATATALQQQINKAPTWGKGLSLVRLGAWGDAFASRIIMLMMHGAKHAHAPAVVDAHAPVEAVAPAAPAVVDAHAPVEAVAPAAPAVVAPISFESVLSAIENKQFSIEQMLLLSEALERQVLALA